MSIFTPEKNADQDVVKLMKGWIVPFILLFLILASLAYTTVFSLFYPLTWAILLAFIFYPAYQMLLKMIGGHHKNTAAALVTFLMVALLVVPTLGAGVVTSREAIGLYGKLSGIVSNIDTSKGLSLGALLPDAVVGELVPVFEKYPQLREGTQQFLSWAASTMIRLSRNFLGNTVVLLFHLIIIFIAFYFLLRDGHVILSYFKDIIPLASVERDEFVSRADTVLRAVVFGVVITAGVQGVLGGLGWWFVGLSNPLLAGALMALLAMIPFVGTPTVWIPGSIYLFLVGDTKNCVILLLWGFCVVSTIDNFIRPYFISGKGNMSTLLVFLGAFGGLAAWGFIGLFVGPLILSLFVFSMDSYRNAWILYQTDQSSREEIRKRRVRNSDAGQKIISEETR
ncbi:AI-2E family transporter [Synergistales bacterium]|nr:AI-2E family transporter [Synergistales bacterium]